jgi:hypothetical protein
MAELAVTSGWAFSALKLSVSKKCGGQASAVRASGPTARPAHSSAHFVDADLDAAFPSDFLLGRCNPTDPFVSREWGDIDPKAFGRGVGFDGAPKVCRKLMDGAACDFLNCHRSNHTCLESHTINEVADECQNRR